MEWIQKGLNNNIHAPIPVCGEKDNNNNYKFAVKNVCVGIEGVFLYEFSIKV